MPNTHAWAALAIKHEAWAHLCAACALLACQTLMLGQPWLLNMKPGRILALLVHRLTTETLQFHCHPCGASASLHVVYTAWAVKQEAGAHPCAASALFCVCFCEFVTAFSSGPADPECGVTPVRPLVTAFSSRPNQNVF